MIPYVLIHNEINYLKKQILFLYNVGGHGDLIL